MGAGHHHEIDHVHTHNHGHDHAHDHSHAAKSSHSHGHGHSHGAGHHHHHHGPSDGPVFAIAVGLNSLFVVAETVAGVVGHSTALLADAGHNFSDVLALLLAWGANRLAKRPPTARFTYGMKSASILAALANASLLWLALGAILIETIRSFATPQTVSAPMVMAVAAGGIAVNGLSALLFARGSKDDINMRAAFQHLMADAVVSAGVVIAGAVVLFTGWNWIDPVTSLVITALIALSSWSLLRESVQFGLLGVPAGIEHDKVRSFLGQQPGVTAVHDLHIWPMSTTETALTAHVVMPDGHPGDAFLHHLAHEMKDDFGIGHATFQIETESGHDCVLHPDAVI